MASLPAFQDDIVPEYEVHEFDPLLDSSNMTPRQWLHIAEVIRENWEEIGRAHV